MEETCPRNYNLVSFPVGKLLKGEDLLAAYKMVKSVAKGCDVIVKSLPGDGDTRLTSIQHGGEFSFTGTEHVELTKLEYPPFLYFSEEGDFPLQDICHVIKKLINNLHYHDTRFMFMADPDQVEDSKYVLNWSIILELAEKNEEFRDSVSLLPCNMQINKTHPAQVNLSQLGNSYLQLDMLVLGRT